MKSFAMGIALIAAAPAHAAPPSPVDQQALRQLAERMDSAWTAADADGNADLFAPDATARFGEDALGQGRDAIRGQFREFFKDRPPGLRHVTRIERIEQMAPDLALWDAEVRVERSDGNGGWAVLSRIRNVTLAVHRSEGWRIQTVRAFPVR